MNPLSICNKIIEYSFYALFFLTPLFFSGSTFELFEFNKMWLVFALTIIITTTWLCKMLIQRTFWVQRTPLDIPIALFFLSQAIATVFSMDTHVSLWGYYSRFNGGLYSTIAYILLYYAFVSFVFSQKDTTTASHKDTVPFATRLLLFASGAGVLLFSTISLVIFKDATDPGSLTIKALMQAAGVFTAFFLFIKALSGQNMVHRTLFMGLLSAGIVALWGFPSHFGYDPTCLQFRGTFDVSCWTDAFQPKVRIFSMLGQPNWLAAFMALLIPIIVGYFLKFFSKEQQEPMQQKAHKQHKTTQTLASVPPILLLIVGLTITLFYVDLLFTDSQSGFIAIVCSMIVFLGLFLWQRNQFPKQLIRTMLFILVGLGLLTFLFGIPLRTTKPLTLPEIISKMQNTQQQSKQQVAKQEAATPALESGITSSSKIRSIVWKGAIDIWKDHPFFGTGVETFAFAYYKYRPVEHNLTTEWDYLYNKAHNEFLNYLATTGAFGLGSYLLFIGWFIGYTLIYLRKKKSEETLVIIGLLSGFVTILITNFFGFSVVLTNLYLFLIPAFIFVLFQEPKLRPIAYPQRAHTDKQHAREDISAPATIGMLILILSSLVLLFLLYIYREADKSYALGNNLNKVNQYQQATEHLQNAVMTRTDEPVFQDELSINLGARAYIAAYEKKATEAAAFAKQAVDLSNHVVLNNPNNVVFWKTRVRLFNILGQLNTDYLKFALDAVKKTATLAPTDAKILYNLGLLYGQTGEPQKAVEVLEKTIQYKPDYRDAYYAKALFLHDLAIDKSGKVIKPEIQKQANDTLRYLLTKISSTDKEAQEQLKKWEGQ